MASENGWNPAKAEPSATEWITVPGTDVALQLLRGWPLSVMRAFAADYNAYVEPLRDADSASWTPTNSVPTSNHLNGTAMDLNWNSHPFHVKGTFTGAQMKTIRELLAFYEDTIYWGGDWYDPIDEMHWQMGYSTYNNPAVGDFIARKIRADGFSTFRRDGKAPAVDAATVLSAATGLPVSRAREILPALMDGLELAECNNVNRIAMALAQWGHESDSFNATEEYASGDEGQERWKYKGRTWIQLTWKSNYAGFSLWCFERGLVVSPTYFVDNPKSLADLRWAGLGAAYYWTVARPDINSLSDRKDIVAVTQRINGGQNGIDDRRRRYNLALTLGDKLLTLVKKRDGVLMALTDDEQRELLQNTRELLAQLGPNKWGPESSFGKDAKGNELTLRDGMAAAKRFIENPKVAIVTFETAASAAGQKLLEAK